MPSSTFIRTVSTVSRLHVPGSSTKALGLARFPRFPLSSRSLQRPYTTVGATYTSPKPPSRLRRFLGFTTIAAFAFTAGLFYQVSTKLLPIMNGPVPTDEETLTMYTPSDELSQEVEDHIKNHPLFVSLREDPSYVESRPYMKIPEKIRDRSLTAGTLSNSGGIVVPPTAFYNNDTNTLVTFFYLGSRVSGHPGIVHGGFLATLLDEGMGRCAFPVLPNKVGVTANLNVDYRRPAMANSYFVMHAQVVKSEGRKAWVEARIETLPEEGQEPVVLVEAKSLFIEPKQAAAVSPKLHKFVN
ncbi:HotDog domain-containing protein [Aspergillus nidulans var. acristatus]